MFIILIKKNLKIIIYKISLILKKYKIKHFISALCLQCLYRIFNHKLIYSIEHSRNASLHPYNISNNYMYVYVFIYILELNIHNWIINVSNDDVLHTGYLMISPVNIYGVGNVNLGAVT